MAKQTPHTHCVSVQEFGDATPHTQGRGDIGPSILSVPQLS